MIKKANKKRDKSPSLKNGEETDKAHIENVVLNDSNWQCTVILFIVETEKLYENLIEIFSIMPANITIINKETIFKNTKVKNKGRKSRGSSASPSATVKTKTKTKPAKNKFSIPKSKENLKETDDKNEESNSVKMCVSIKKLLIDLRESDTKSLTGNKKENKTKITKEDKKVEQNKKLKVDKLSDNENENNSHEIDHIIPHRYIILCGFYDPKMAEELLALGIPLKSIINVREVENEFKLSKELSSLGTTEIKSKILTKNENKSLEEINSDEYINFLDDMNKNISSDQYLEKLKNVLFLNYMMNASSNKEISPKSPQNLLKILHGIKEAWTKFEKYNEIIEIHDIPVVEKPLPLGDASIYNTMISMVPLESVSIPVILHCIIEQIAWWDRTQSNSESGHNGDSNYNVENKSKVSNQETKNIKNITPILIDRKDEIKLTTFHLNLPEMNFNQITKNVLISSPVFRLWERHPPPPPSQTKWDEYQVHKLKKCAENKYIDFHKVYLVYLHQSVINIMISNLKNIIKSDDNDSDYEYSKLNTDDNDTFFFSSNKEPVYDDHPNPVVAEIICNILCLVPQFSLEVGSFYQLKENATTLSIKPIECETYKFPIKWYKVEYFKTFSEEISETRQIYKQERLNKLKSFLLSSHFIHLFEEINFLKDYDSLDDNLKNYEFVEELDSNVFCQSLQKAFQTFLNVHFEYFAPTDSILLWFNNIDHNSIVWSQKIKCILETPLGFRDFYKHKLGGKTNLVEISSQMETVSDPTISQVELHELKSNHTIHHESHVKVDEFEPSKVYNLSSLRTEVNETCKYFTSPDSSFVMVKHKHYFSSSKTSFSVNVKKNNCSLNYEINPAIPSKSVNILMDICSDLVVNCTLTWNKQLTDDHGNAGIHMEDPDLLKEDNFQLYCNINITLPSGLLVQVVKTDSTTGSFYIRQRYLGKGPVCSNIWEESYRCYLSDGTIIIFYCYDSVAIYYSNGTTVKCNSIERVEQHIPSNFNENNLEQINRYNYDEKEEENKTKNTKSDKHKIKEKNKQKNENESRTIPSKGKESRLENKIKKESVSVSLPNTTDNNVISTEEKDKMNISCKITEHEVFSWDGEYTKFINDEVLIKEKQKNLRMAFECINHEMFLERSGNGKLRTLFTPEYLNVTFPDGTKTTCFVEDHKTLNAQSDNLMENESKTSASNLSESIAMENYFPMYKSQSSTLVSSLGSISVNDSNHSDSLQNDESVFVYVESTYILEHRNYATVKYVNGNEAELGFPGNIVFKIDKNRMFSINISENDKIVMSNNTLSFESYVLSNTLHPSSTTLLIQNENSTPTITCQTVDSFGNMFTVDEQGNTTEIHSDIKINRRNSSLCSPWFPQNVERFFVMNRNFTGYEMIHNTQKESLFSNKIRQKDIIKTPLTEDSSNFYSICLQKPIYKTKSEKYLVSPVKEKILPKLIKRKDLLKTHQMPETIWFDTKLSTASEMNVEHFKSFEIPKAIAITQFIHIKKTIFDQSSWFCKSLNKYMEMSENILKKYSDHYLQDMTRKVKFEDTEELRKEVFDSQSYYLTDNLPKVIINML